VRRTRDHEPHLEFEGGLYSRTDRGSPVHRIALNAWTTAAGRLRGLQGHRRVAGSGRRRRGRDAASGRDRTICRAESAELIVALRRLVQEVMIHAPANTQRRGQGQAGGSGRMAAFPSRSMGGGSMVAGEGLGPTTRKTSTSTINC
jgi:hypothetical protein